MLWTPNPHRHKIITNTGIVGSATPGTAVVSSGTTLLDGAVTELISAANNIQDSWGISLMIDGTGPGTAAAEGCMDILIGGATDDILIASLIVGYCRPSIGVRQYFFPLHIPQGKRIAATFASVIVSRSAKVSAWLHGGGDPPFRVGRKVTTYGTAINNARGQAIVPTASGGAASVTEMIASSAEDHFAFMPGFQPATTTTVTPDGYVNLGIGVGAATEDRIGTWWMAKNTSEGVLGPFPAFPAFCDVPAASRLSILASNSGANDTAYDGFIYAMS